jgi:formylglycine-generating enzyme required for sulfatase activity
MPQRCELRPGWFLGAWILFAPGVPAHETFQDCPDCPRMVVISGGSFTMGSPVNEPERRKFEGPQDNVKVAGFAIGATEVTRRQYAAFVEATKRPAAGGCFTYGFSSITDAETVDLNASWRNPAFAQAADHPVVCVSWEDAKDYVAWLARKTGQAYRLPSEAEWEYAARAGTTSTFFWGDAEERGCAYVNGGDPSLLRALPALKEAIAKSLSDGDAGSRFVKCDDGSAFTAAVGRYQPNAFGLYDMIGNAWELVEDCWYESLPTSGLAHVEDSCEFHRGRGGSWDDFPEELRSARRSRLDRKARRNDVGFRIARTLSVGEAERPAE